MPQSNILTLLFIPLMIVAFYFLLIRPQRKRQQEQQKMLNELQPGSRVMTTTGIFGTLVSMGDKQAVIEVSPGVEITLLRQAVSRAVSDTDEDTPAPEVVPGEEPDFDPYAPGEPSTLDLETEGTGLRDVTSSYSGAAANAAADDVSDVSDPAVDEPAAVEGAPSDGAPADAPEFVSPEDPTAGGTPEVTHKDA